MADFFLDTNVILYASNGRFDEPEKHGIGLALLGRPFGLSSQVLAEFYTNATRKGVIPLSATDAKTWVENLSKKPCQPIDAGIVKAGISFSQRYKISYWDGAIIAAAQALGCKTIYSEDLNNGQRYDGVEVINPFL